MSSIFCCLRKMEHVSAVFSYRAYSTNETICLVYRYSATILFPICLENTGNLLAMSPIKLYFLCRCTLMSFYVWPTYWTTTSCSLKWCCVCMRATVRLESGQDDKCLTAHDPNSDRTLSAWYVSRILDMEVWTFLLVYEYFSYVFRGHSLSEVRICLKEGFMRCVFGRKLCLEAYICECQRSIISSVTLRSEALYAHSLWRCLRWLCLCFRQPRIHALKILRWIVRQIAQTKQFLIGETRSFNCCFDRTQMHMDSLVKPIFGSGSEV